VPAPEITAGDEDGSMESLRRSFEAEEYYYVIEGARQFVGMYPGSRYLDEAWFLLARSEYEEGNYMEAEGRFRRLLRDFPQSEYAEESHYQLALALLSQSRGAELDQTETRAALREFESFLSRYPDSPFAERATNHVNGIRAKLAEKAYKNGETYRKVKSWDGARFYYAKVFEEWPEAPYASRAVLRLAELAERGEEWSEVARWAGRLLADYPDSPEAGSARGLLEKAQRKLDEAGSADAAGN
jgi:outer membrane protein assembly factor BamD